MKDEEYQKYRNLIRERAWHWAIKTSLPYNDFFSRGNEVFVNCILRFKDDAGVQFTTYLRKSLDNAFTDIPTKEYRYSGLSEEVANALKAPDSRRIRQNIISLDRDAYWLVLQILEGEAPIRHRHYKDGGGISPRNTRSAIKTWLREEIGWGLPRIYKAFSNIEKTL